MSMLEVQKVRTVIQTVLLVLGLAVVAAACAWTLWGLDGVIWAGIAVAALVVMTPAAPPALVMRLARGREIDPWTFPEGYRILETLSRRAGLPRRPRLFYVPSPTPNAFAVGAPGNAAIAVTDGVLRTMGMRELNAILAHEVGHIVNGDLRIMALVGALGRAAILLSFLGVILLALNLPLILMGAVQVPWVVALGLAAAPLLVDLLQLGVSRAREYDADLEAVALTGDPDGMISALWRLEQVQRRTVLGMSVPFGLSRPPSLLRTHPPTEERVRRLRAVSAGTPMAGSESFAGGFGVSSWPGASGLGIRPWESTLGEATLGESTLGEPPLGESPWKPSPHHPHPSIPVSAPSPWGRRPGRD